MEFPFLFLRYCGYSVKKEFTRFILVSAICLGSAGCAGMVAKPVADSQKDQSGKFDGVWQGKVSGGGSVQYVGSQGLRCSKQNRTVQLRVEDGKLRSVYGLPSGETNVGSDGKFRLEIPTDREFSGGNFQVQKPGITLVLQGNLEANVKKGLYVIGMQQLNNEGCSYRMDLVPVSSKNNAGNTRDYSNNYKNIYVGVTSRVAVIARFGKPVKIESSTRFRFEGGFDLTFDQRDKVNTIIIYDPDYTDRHGLAIGMPKSLVAGIDSIRMQGSNAVDPENGMVYWFDDNRKIREIVLANRLVIN